MFFMASASVLKDRGAVLCIYYMAVFCSASPAMAHLPHNLTEHFISVPLDHTAPWTGRILRMRYLLDTTHFERGGPIVAYTGNEGDIEGFASACGFLWELAVRFSGAVVFMEERYYGKSIPAQTKSEPRYRYLASAHVVADFALTLASLREQFNTSKVIAVGGSYGGMLAALLRKQHPDLVSAALAASAPMLGFATTLLKQHRATHFWEIAERAYPCRDTLGAAFRALWAAPAAAWPQIGADFGLCPSHGIRDQLAIESLIGFLQQQLSNLAFSNYPYAVGEMPANPTLVACSKAEWSRHSPGEAQYLGAAENSWPRPTPSEATAARRAAAGWLPLRDALSWYYQRDGACLSLEPSFTAYTPGFLPGPWIFQRCTDLVMAFEVPTTSRMALPCAAGFRANCAADGQAALRTFCNATFGATVPDPAKLQDLWGSDWTAAGGGSRIIFSNGDLDPWAYGGVLDSVAGGASDAPLVVHIAAGAHHLDLRGSHPHDPPSVVAAREYEAAALGRWIGF